MIFTSWRPNALVVQLFVLGTLLTAAGARAQTSFPMITHVTPVALQRGTTAELTVEGQMSFAGAYKVLFEGTGLTAEIVPVPAPAANPSPKTAARSVKLKVTATAEAALGPREFRIACGLGLSSIGQMVVVDGPVVSENGDNNSLQKANPITVPCTVAGRIEAAEDVDFFKFHARPGQMITFEVYCARIQDKIHDLQGHADPMLTLYDAEGRELAANDDFYFADPMLAYTFKTEGDYFIQVRDSKYLGDPRWAYALIVTDKPYVSHVFPMAGNPGQTVEVELVGSARGVKPRASCSLPKEPGIHRLQLDLGNDQKTNPATFIVSPLPQFLEQEPNDTPEQANRITLPCGINGRIGSKRDADHFIFTAKKGQALRFEVKARRFGTDLMSSLDSFLEIMTPKGQVLASNDDAVGKDSMLVFSPPADGDYVLCIRDLNSKGGDTWIYYIEADFARPDFTLRCDPDKAMVGPGSSTAWYVHVVRSNGFEGPVKIEVKGLPREFTVNPLVIHPTMTQGLLVLMAAEKAAIDAVPVQVVGTAAVKTIDGTEEVQTRTAQPNQEIYSPGGGRARFDVNMQAVAITEPSDVLKVEVSQKEIKLRPGEEVKIEVTIQRRPDFDKNVFLDVLLQHLGSVMGNPLPPGVTIDVNKSKTLLGNGNKGQIVLKAAPNAAPIENVPISVLAHVSINFVVKVSYSSDVISLSVVK
jgi:hypothetical protein